MSRKRYIGTIRVPNGEEFPFNMEARNRKHVAKILDKVTPKGTLLLECVRMIGANDRYYKANARNVEANLKNSLTSQ